MTTEDILNGVARENGVRVSDIRKPGRAHYRLWLIQAQAARRLRGRNYSLPEIGKALNKHHSSIHSMIHGGKSKIYNVR